MSYLTTTRDCVLIICYISKPIIIRSNMIWVYLWHPDCLTSLQLFGWRGCPLLLRLIRYPAKVQLISKESTVIMSSLWVCEWTTHIKKISHWQTALTIIIINANRLPLQSMLQLRALAAQKKCKSAPPSRLANFHDHACNLCESASVVKFRNLDAAKTAHEGADSNSNPVRTWRKI